MFITYVTSLQNIAYVQYIHKDINLQYMNSFWDSGKQLNMSSAKLFALKISTHLEPAQNTSETPAVKLVENNSFSSLLHCVCQITSFFHSPCGD